MERLRQTPIKAINEHLPLVGQEVYPITTRVGLKTSRFSHKMEKKIAPNKHVCSALSFRLHHNSEAASSEKFGNRRPASAYFTLMDKKLIIEWGEIDPGGNGRLHDYLHRNIDFDTRRKKGGVVRSGHIGWITTPDHSVETRIALIDSIDSTTDLTEDRSEYPIITTLLNNRIIPVTTDGSVIAISLDGRIRIVA